MMSVTVAPIPAIKKVVRKSELPLPAIPEQNIPAPAKLTEEEVKIKY